MKRHAAILAALALAYVPGAQAQQTMLFGGAAAVRGHAPMAIGQSATQPVFTDSGTAAGVGLGLSEILLSVRGTGIAPYADAGSGPFGTNECNYDAPTSNATGYHFLCLGPNSNGGGILAYGAGGSAPHLPFTINVDGVTTFTINDTGAFINGNPITAGTTVPTVLAGNVTMFQNFATTTWAAQNPAGTPVSFSGTTTGGLQETINAAYTSLGTTGYDLAINGGDVNTGGATGLIVPSTVTWHAAQGKRTRIGSVTLDLQSGGGAGTGMIFDSQEMQDWEMSGGQIAYGGTTWPVLFKATTGTPLDGSIAQVDSRFAMTTTAAIGFDFSGAGSNGALYSTFAITELNMANAFNHPANPANAGIYAPSPGVNQNFADNNISVQHLHDLSATDTAVKIGNGAPAGLLGHNFWNLHIGAPANTAANGIDTYETGSLYLATIEGISSGTSIKMEAGACGNIFIIPANSAWATLNDASSCTGTNSNTILGNGKLTIGPTVSIGDTLSTLTALTATGQTLLGGSGGHQAMRANVSASSVNFTDFFGGDTGVRPTISFTGSDTDVGANITTKGAGNLFLLSGFNADVMAEFVAVAGATHSFTFTPSVSGNPVFNVTGGTLSIPAATIFGTGLTVTGTLNVTSGYSINGAAGVTQTCTVNQAKTLIFTNGILTGGTCNS